MFWRDGPEQDEPSAFIHLPPFLRHTLFKLFGDMFWRDLPDLEQLSPLRLTHLPAALYPQTLGERFWRELVFLDLLKDLTLLKIFLSLERFSKDSRDDLSERSPTRPAAWVGICPRILTLPSSLSHHWLASKGLQAWRTFLLLLLSSH